MTLERMIQVAQDWVFTPLQAAFNKFKMGKRTIPETGFTTDPEGKRARLDGAAAKNMESSPSTSDIDQDSGRSFMNASTLEENWEIAEHSQELLQPAGSSSGSREDAGQSTDYDETGELL
ncbi:hypothetical protein RvY_04080-2 [Ramazzottius varieornatus]|uniref:Uncharacterized protein n=1 Tax=Ramazzottius varieornatus TaxID=947166 RepID=A0A1D1UQD1_RAMVA|nr:hypothetical protein RvY_04080-2 [Ramazzottius varieornatus]